MKLHSFIFLASIAILLNGCSFHANNWQGTNPPGLDKASFSNFTGKNVDTITITAGSSVVINYHAATKEGSLTITVRDRSKILWQKQFVQVTDSGRLVFTAVVTTTYKITIACKGASGSFEVAYKSNAPKQINVVANKNIELFGLIVQLDNGEDLLSRKDTVVIEGRRATWADWYRATVNNYLQYKQFASSDMVKLYEDYGKRSYYDDFFIGFLLQVDEVPNAKLNATTDTALIHAFAPAGSLEDGKRVASDFLAAMNRFYVATSFENYLTSHAAYYEAIKADVRRNLPKQGFLDTVEHFYQKQFNSYTLVPSLNLLTSVGYGKMNINTRAIFNAFGPFSFQTFQPGKEELGFNFPDRIRNLSVHEFGHSFVNPAIDKVPGKVIAATEYLFTPIKDEMAKMSYPGWKICLYEHFVRAGEVIIARRLGDTTYANKMIEDNVKTRFIYLPAIVKQLEIYDSNRALYPSYDDFVARVVTNLKPVQQ